MNNSLRSLRGVAIAALPLILSSLVSGQTGALQGRSGDPLPKSSMKSLGVEGWEAVLERDRKSVV